jgi:outer membrane protein, heavy metal efflux system
MHRASQSIHLAGAFLVSLVSLCGCAMQSYRAAPIDPAGSAQSFEARTLDTPALKEYMLAHGYPSSAWPVERWGLTELTLLAFHYHPDLQVARAQALALRAEAAAAVPRVPLAVTPRIEHHSLRTAEQSSPWSLGFEVQIPLAFAATGDAIRSRYDALAQAADLRIGAAAWDVRSHVRTRLLDLYGNDAEAQLLQGEVRAREALLALLEQRLQAGAASAVEVNSARLALIDVRSRLQVARSAGERVLGALAEALALPLATVRSMQLDYAELQRPAPPPQDAQTRRAALLNRLDIRGKLLEYAAAEAEVRLEIARQYPTISITPGFLWDQGDNIWSLAATLVPAVLGNRPAIAAAQARREVEASQFQALQGKVIAQAQSADAAYASLAQALAQAEQISALQAARVQQIERQFEAGYADRVELTAVRLETIAAQRGAVALRIETLRAQGVLEDALQIPLAGGPLPRVAQTPSAYVTGLARE